MSFETGSQEGFPKENLVESARQVDPMMSIDGDEFPELYRVNHKKLMQLFKQRGHEVDECLDLVQETFLAAFKDLNTFRGDSRLDTWLLAIGLNISRAYYRRKGRRENTAKMVSFEEGGVLTNDNLVSFPNEGLNGDTYLIAEERRKRLKEAFDGLYPDTRRCICLKYNEGMTYKQIAMVLKIKERAVKEHLVKGKNLLRQLLRPKYKG